jgi:hypothetical protein
MSKIQIPLYRSDCKRLYRCLIFLRTRIYTNIKTLTINPVEGKQIQDDCTALKNLIDLLISIDDSLHFPEK